MLSLAWACSAMLDMATQATPCHLRLSKKDNPCESAK
jgi:hypothetical protein